MSVWSKERKTYLLTREECCSFFGVSLSKVKRAMSRPNCYVEHQSVERAGRGKTTRAFVDPTTLGFEMLSSLAQFAGEPANSSVAQFAGSPAVLLSQRTNFPSAPAKSTLSSSGHQSFTGPEILSQRTRSLAQIDDLAVKRHARLQTVLRERKGSSARAEAIRSAATEFEVSERSVRHWITALEKQANSAYALSRLRRADKGQHRFPDEIRELVTAVFLNNRPGVSANAVYRVLARSVPELMEYSTKGGKPKRIEPWTVRAIQKDLESDPVMQLIFKDTTERKEFLRVYNGKVLALHANWQWQIDMTRCDVEVYDPVTREFYRLRIHSVIDVFSGCIMGLSFSRNEDTVQTKIALLRALTPKHGRFAHLYPMYGTPNTIYWDNGKTYVCEETERVVAHLSIESVHSMPRVSHTRGKVERQFGTFHQMIERTLPGYVGEDAKNRDSEELRALRERTLRWAATGRDPGRQNRHLTPDEFKSIALMWLLTEYHQMVQPCGLTRQEMYLASVEAEAKHTLRLYDPTELFYLFARRTERTVTPDGGILYQNRIFKSPTGQLAGYAGRKVMLLEDSFSPESWYGVMYQLPDGSLRDLGDVEPASEWANSEQSVQTRKLEKTKRRELIEDFKAIQQRTLQPELNIAESLMRALPEAQDDIPTIDVTPLPLPTSRVRLATTERAEDMGDFGKFLDVGADAQTAEDFMAAVKNTLPGRKK